MIAKIYAVRDAAVEGFLQPFFSQSHGAAIRSLTDAVNDPKHPFATNARYYSLYHIGDFDDASGIIYSDKPIHLADCLQLMITQ